MTNKFESNTTQVTVGETKETTLVDENGVALKTRREKVSKLYKASEPRYIKNINNVLTQKIV